MNLIEENCKKCKNYEICQSTGCAIKIQIENLLKTNDHRLQILNEIKKYIESQSPEAGVCGKTILEIIERGDRE